MVGRYNKNKFIRNEGRQSAKNSFLEFCVPIKNYLFSCDEVQSIFEMLGIHDFMLIKALSVKAILSNNPYVRFTAVEILYYYFFSIQA